MKENEEGTEATNESVDDQDFDKAFDEASAEQINPTVPEVPEEKNEEVVEPVAPVVEPVTPVEPPPTNPAWEAKEKEYLAEIENLRKKFESNIKALPVVTDPYASLTEDEKKALEEYEAEFGEVSKYEDIKRKAEVAATAAALRKEFTEALDKITQTFSPVTKLADDYGRDKHFNEIRSKHSDFDTLVQTGEVAKWIKSRPREMSNVYQEWYNQGTAEQVVTLFDQYKNDNNITAPLVVQNDLKKEQKKQNLTAIPNKTTPVASSAASKDDFESAFDEAVRQ